MAACPSVRCQRWDTTTVQLAERHVPRIFTITSHALHAIFTPALVDWRVNKVCDVREAKQQLEHHIDALEKGLMRA